MFAKACEYGTRAAIYIAEQSLEDRKVSLKEVAEAIDSPEAYTSKILQLLSHNQLIISEKGPAGGYRSEEHTSELQSRENLVCRLLLHTSTYETSSLPLHDALPI